ncbi:MAG: LuxR C-terminal-related transcriptional regulator [Roseobacter sp.]
MADKHIKDVENSLRNMASDPFGFTELVDAWNAVFECEERENIRPNTFDGVLNETLQTITREGAGDAIGTRVRQMVNALPHMAFVVRSDGLIAAMNDAALSRMSVDPGQNVDQIGYLLESGESLTDLIVRSVDRRNAIGDVMMKRALHDQSERSATLAIVPSFEDGLARALVFVIDPVWRDEVRAVVSRAYGLTDAELEILMAFLDGHSLRSIATQRGRSHTTVRTQFQAIMNKAGARSQAELMRNTIAVSQFFTDIGDVADVARHPDRRRFDMLAPGGRLVDVTLTGDMSGPMIVCIPDASQFLFPARIEKAFRQAGLCVAFVCRPGTGRTDAAPAGQDYIECLGADVVCLLDQMRKTRAVLMSNNMSSVFVYRLGSLIPDRLSRIIVTSTLVPGPYLDGTKTRSPWARALMRAARGSPGMYKVMIHAAIKAWKAMGSRRMYLLQLKGFAPDEEIGKQPDVVAAYDLAMRTMLSQGTDHAVISFEYAAQDWSGWIDACETPIDLVQGVHSPSSSFEVVEAFAARHSDKITLQALPDAGYLPFFTHTDVMIDKLRQAANQADRGAS